MNIDDLGKAALSRTLGGFTIEKLLQARQRTAPADASRWASPVIVETSGDHDEIVAMKLRDDVVQTGGRLTLQAVLDGGTLGAAAVLEVRDAPLATPTLTAPGDAAQNAATHLKMMLALRDWADPYAMLPPGLDEQTADLALAIVAPEVRTDVTRRPGRWYYEVSARRRILGSRDLAELRGCLAARGPDDAQDPVRRAFELLLADPPADPGADIGLELLRALHCASDWLGERCKVDRDHIAALIEKRMRQEDVDRILREPLIGRNLQRERLHDFVMAPRTGRQLGVLEIYGVGGSGKSTLLAHVEATTRGVPDPPVLVHLDFDREFLDVDDPYSLDLALLDAIAGARPDKAAACLSLANDLASLRQAEREDRQSLLGRKGRRLDAAARKSSFGFAEQEALESHDAGGGSRRLSLLWNSLGSGSNVGAGVRLALVLDTLEHVFGRGASATRALALWLDSLTKELGAEGACVILSGRDPPPAEPSLHLPSVLQDMGHWIDLPAMELGELDMDDAVHFLETYGVDDPATAQAAAGALPRVPLLLRIGADVLVEEKEVAEEVRAAHAEGRVDAETSRRYLTSRIVRHVADPVARDYVLAAFALPEVTEKLLRDVVVPVVDEAAGREAERGRAKRVHKALSDSTWLTTKAPDLQSFTFLPAIRSLALKLIASDPAEDSVVRQVRMAAIAKHDRGRTPKDAAFALYHRLMLGRRSGPVVDAKQATAILARFLDDLPEAARAVLLSGEQIGSASPVDSPEQWRAYLEGVGRERGQGLALVQRGEAEAALSLYKDRPTREPGLPPDFVIQALAYGGNWDDSIVDVEAVLEEIADRSRRADGRWQVPGTLRSRLYWITRLELLRNPGPLSPRHESLLAGAAADIKAVYGEAALPAIIAVAEAFSGSRIGMPSWLKARGAIGRVVRYPLVQSLIHGNPVEWRTPVEAMVVAQDDWEERDLDLDVLDFSIALRSEARETIQDLKGLPLHQVDRQLRKLRKPIQVPVPDLKPLEQVILLRGKTTEFLRPLAHALSRPMDSESSIARAIGKAHQATLDRMSILPEVPLPEEMARRTDASKEKSWLGLIDLFDLARVLPYFCRRLCAAGPGSDIGRIANTFLAWDAALTRGGSSEWMHERVGEWETRDPAASRAAPT